MAKDTNVIDTKIYPIVSSTLSKSLVKFKKVIGDFLNSRNQALYDTFPATRMVYGQTDADMMYDVFGYKGKEKELEGFLKETYYGSIANFNPRAAKNPLTVLMMCVIKYFFNKKDQKNLELAMIYLSFSGNFYPSIHYAIYPKALPADYRYVCDYVINNELTNKYDLKTQGSVIGAVKSIDNTWINTYKDMFQGKSSDEDYVYLIQQLHSRIKSFMKNIAELYYKCYNNKDYLTYNSDDMSQDSFRLTENDTAKIANVSQRAITYLTTHDVDYRICKMCADQNVKTDEIKGIIESIVKNSENLDDMTELVNLIVSIYFEHSKNKDVRDIEFVTFTIKAKPNSKDKNIARQNEIIEKFLTEGSMAYNRRKSRVATRLSYNRAVLIYFALIINQANKV